MLRDAIADQLNSAVGGVIDTIMKGIWAASVWLLRSVFELVLSQSGVCSCRVGERVQQHVGDFRVFGCGG